MRPLTGDSDEKRDIFHYNVYIAYVCMCTCMYEPVLRLSTSLNVSMCRFFIYSHTYPQPAFAISRFHGLAIFFATLLPSTPLFAFLFI